MLSHKYQYGAVALPAYLVEYIPKSDVMSDCTSHYLFHDAVGVAVFAMFDLGDFFLFTLLNVSRYKVFEIWISTPSESILSYLKVFVTYYVGDSSPIALLKFTIYVL